MIISVVNHSEYTDTYVQEVLRAINRQIAEDFAPYWHRSGELRLEGAVGRQPNPKKPEELRGDAILYLWDKVDQQADALGFHDLNFRGIAFSIVFTQLSEQLGEDWTVTLSHEALELIMDPEANLLVQGPHPETPDRLVYHWYEMCDAVQAQTYFIDEIEVSNFVLPLYFTDSDEEGSRNDFLGIQNEDGSSLPSFGVAPGGYVGFYDPDVGDHDQFVSRTPPPKKKKTARERLAIRSAAGLTRRTVRRQQETSSEDVVRKLYNRNEEDSLPGPWFEGFTIDVRRGGRTDPLDVLEAAAKAALGSGWAQHWDAFEPNNTLYDDGPLPYELIPREAVSVASAWELCYALREEPGIVDVEPDFVFFRADSEALDAIPPGQRMFLFGSKHLDGSKPPEWSLDQIRAKQAWVYTQGEQVTIAHPDTGFLKHPEIWPKVGGGPIDTIRDWDFVTDDDDARAELDDDNLLPGGPNHGTSTASVIVSATGPADSAATGEPFVSGIAPNAKLVPLRVSNSVVHFSFRRVRKAIEYATDNGFHVISMSLGGPAPSKHLRRAIQAATKRGLIVIAAAGNSIPFRPVIWPARYPECIAVAACNADRKHWKGSSRGGAIDITAPGESVWRALVDEKGVDEYLVERSSGTSYATATVAGVCALWISHHGWQVLFDKYGEHMADAFRSVLAKTAQKSDHLDPDKFGPGIVDAEKVLLEPLPSTQAVRGNRGGRSRRAAAGARRGDEGSLSTIEAMFPQLSRAEVMSGLEALLDTDAKGVAKRLREVGDELAFQLAIDPRLRRRLGARARRAMGGAKTSGARLWRAAASEDLRTHLRRTGSSRLNQSIN